jgi:hypothetical protein
MTDVNADTADIIDKSTTPLAFETTFVSNNTTESTGSGDNRVEAEDRYASYT